MKDSIRVIDDFCSDIDRVRASAIAAGFGTWRPNKGEIGSSVYDGMGFWGDHSRLLLSLNIVERSAVLPNSMFFRVTRPDMERAYIHSDRESGARTCIVYLSEHQESYGTAFYRHKETGLSEMPTFQEMTDPRFDQLKFDMVSGDLSKWDQLDFVSGRYNRAVIFDAPLFHSRIPMNGIGSNDSDSRLVWACHFHSPNTIGVNS